MHQFIGPPLHGIFAELTGDEALVQACVDAYRARYRSHSALETTVMDGMTDAIATLGERRPLAVATSKPRALTEPLLEAMGLRAHFAAVEGPSLDAEAEPKAETIRRALVGLPPGSSPVMVGDRRFGPAARDDPLAQFRREQRNPLAQPAVRGVVRRSRVPAHRLDERR